MKVKCIIVDDEPLAREAVEMLLEPYKDIEITARCENAIEAFEAIKRRPVNLMFLDIQMPNLSGIDFLKTLKAPPKVIITTAYPNYALEGYSLDVVDYLMKPIAADKFMCAVEKFYRLWGAENLLNSSSQGPNTTRENKDFLFIRADRKTVRVKYDDILYLESMKDYVKIRTTKETIITKNQLQNFESKLPEDLFLRIHRSYIVAVSKIDAFSSDSLFIGKSEIPISNTYKNSVANILRLKDNII